MTTLDIDLDADARIARLEEMEARATRRPWTSFDSSGIRSIFAGKPKTKLEGGKEIVAWRGFDQADTSDAKKAANAALIAAVRNDLPWLLEQARAVIELRATVARLTNERDMHDTAATAEGEISDAEKARANAAEATVARLQQENADLAAKLHKAEQDAARQAVLARTRLAEKDGEITGLREALRPFAARAKGKSRQADDVHIIVSLSECREAARLADTGRSEPAPEPPARLPLPFSPDDVEVYAYRVGEFAGRVDTHPTGVKVTHRPTGLSAKSEDLGGQHRNRDAALDELARLVRADTERSDADGC